MSARRARGWVFAAGSVALHLVWVLAMRPAKRVSEPVAGAVVEVELVQRAQSPAKTQPAVEEVPPLSRPPVEQRAAVRRVPRRVAEAVRRAVGVQEHEAVAERGAEQRHGGVAEHEHEAVAGRVSEQGHEHEAVAGRVSEQGHESERIAEHEHGRGAGASNVDLSPRRAVVGAYDELTKPRSCLPPAAESGAACVDSARDEIAQGRLDDAIKGTRLVPHLAPRDAPVLHREGDGGYRYDGHVFTAKIDPDGHVRFADIGEEIEFADARDPTTLERPAMLGPSFRGRFDVMDKVERAMGKELYSAEKSWFLEQTTELRARLVAAARARERAAARRYVERELERILAAAELQPEQKRAQVFGIWQDCGDDGDSSDTRRVVEAFVRLRMPAGSALAFTPEELARYNRSRRGLSQFDPYRVPAAGSPG